MLEGEDVKISLITVCFNSEKTIATTLESVLRQKDVDLEYQVLDGASSDGTVDWIRQYAEKFQGRMWWTSEKDAGMYDAINKGILRATGDVIGILNADDAFEKDTILSDVAKRFQADAQLQALYGDVRFVPDPLGEGARLDAFRAGKTIRYYSAKRWRPWMLQWGFMPPHPSVYLRRDCFERLGLYKIDYKIAADYELLVRFLRRGALRTTYFSESLVAMRMGGLSTKNWKSNLLLNQEIVRGNQENGYFCSLLMMLPKYAFKIWEFRFSRSGGKRQ